MAYFDEKRPYNGSRKVHNLSPQRRKRAYFIIAVVGGLTLLYFLVSSISTQSRRNRTPWLIPDSTSSDNTTSDGRLLAFPPPEDYSYRAPDSQDTFASYKYRNACNISSLDLHLPFGPLCQTRQDMLNAMSWGGRIGHDAPYLPRGCDMRWFTTEEICEIMGRFSKVIIMGDSMMRHIIGSMNVLLRKDLGYGAVTDWNFSPEERQNCFCNYQFNVKACSIQGIFKTSDVLAHDPESFQCPPDLVNLLIEVMVRFPIEENELARLREDIGPSKPERPIAFIFGHGLWNDLDLQAHTNWIDTILETIVGHNSYYARDDAFWPRLVVTPNAAGRNKPDEWLVSQGNKALSIYEDSVRIEDGRRGIEHLGTFNMSVQANMYDGGHCDLRGNLIKAMMVINWLNMIDTSAW
ncbi:MAG: hypothetical protein M1828_002572 [Chrysothrix sp. TS-e1954]|nr:MAG: hypothetical protein M1828_002572 [Chrysothrix sp. TS-e1954]